MGHYFLFNIIFTGIQGLFRMYFDIFVDGRFHFCRCGYERKNGLSDISIYWGTLDQQHKNDIENVAMVNQNVFTTYEVKNGL